MTSDKRKVLKFPKGFLFGTAMAAHQVEGDNVHSDWWAWEQESGKREKSGRACLHYEMFEGDFELMKSFLNNNAHRLSIEWARIEPEEGKIDQKEIAHYRRVLSKLRTLGLASMVTLHHYTSPLWFTKKGGFERKENLKFFEKYVALCVQEFGDMVDFWVTINEPNIYIGAGYFVGAWPPQKKSIFLAFKVYLNLVEAHKRAYRIIHQKISDAKVGMATNFGDIPAKKGIFLNHIASVIVNFAVNDFFYFFSAGYHDFLGVNYYQHYRIAWNKIQVTLNYAKGKVLGRKVEPVNKSDIGWNIYPRGVYFVAKRMWKWFKVPIYITENGIADFRDSKRETFIKEHLKWVHRAIGEGVDIRGYFHWSFVDNYEWALGWGPKFGLFEMDKKSFKRIPRKSAYYFAEVARSGEVEV